MDCLKHIVGVSPDSTCCIDGTESLSGFYLTDKDEGFVPVNQGLYSVKDINSTLSKLIENAATEAMMECYKYFNKYLRAKYNDFYHTIGNVSHYTDILPSTSGWYFMAIKPLVKRGGYMDIEKITIKHQNGYHAGNIKILDFNKTVIWEGLIGSMPKQAIQLKEVFYVAYQSTYAPVNFKHIFCCGYSPLHSNYIKIGSGTSATINDIAFKENDYCQGIAIDCGFRCDGFYSLCNIDFKNTRFGVSFAHAVKQIARKNFAYWLMTNDIVTPYVMVNNEELVSIIEFLRTDIEKQMKYLPSVYNLSDCFLCRDNYILGEIMA